MGSFSKTERKLRTEDNKRIVEELVDRILDGEHISKKGVMKEYGITNNKSGWYRIHNLFNQQLIPAIKEKGLRFRCLDKYNSWDWWIIDTETDYQIAYNDQYNDISSRIPCLLELGQEAESKGYQIETKKIKLLKGKNGNTKKTRRD